MCRLQLVEGRQAPSSQAALMRLLHELYSPDADMAKVESIIQRDASLSYRLPKVLNSAAFSLASRVDSVRLALVILGLNNIKTWASMICMASATDKPSERLPVALIRARMCQCLAEVALESNPQKCFTVGLLSVLDALLDRPMDQILNELPLSEEVAAALLRREGTAGAILACVVAYEQGAWDDAGQTRVCSSRIASVWVEAAGWAESVFEGMQ